MSNIYWILLKKDFTKTRFFLFKLNSPCPPSDVTTPVNRWIISWEYSLFSSSLFLSLFSLSDLLQSCPRVGITVWCQAASPQGLVGDEVEVRKGKVGVDVCLPLCASVCVGICVRVCVHMNLYAHAVTYRRIVRKGRKIREASLLQSWDWGCTREHKQQQKIMWKGTKGPHLRN